MPLGRLLRKLNPTISDRVRADRLSYLTIEKLDDLEHHAAQVIEAGVAGMFVEAGVALGGASIVLASYAHPAGRAFRGYDVFEMIPAPGERDDEKSHRRYEVISSGESSGLGGNDEYYGYREDLLSDVKAAFERYGLPVDDHDIRLIRGLFEDTMSFAADDAIALVHVDCDWYEPVKYVLETTYSVLAPGGIVIVDDYHDYGGCRDACEEFIAAHDVTIVTKEHHLVLRRDAT